MSHRATLPAIVLAWALCIQCTTPGQVTPTPAPLPIAKDLPSLLEAVPLVIVGKVVGIQAGRMVGEGDMELQFNDVRVSVEERLKGDAGVEVLVEQLAVSGRAASAEVGPPYRPGERYVLFLRPGEGGRYVSATQGRYSLRSGQVRPTEPGPVADKVRNMSEATFIREIKAVLQEPLSP